MFANNVVMAVGSNVLRSAPMQMSASFLSNRILAAPNSPSAQYSFSAKSAQSYNSASKSLLSRRFLILTVALGS